MHTVGMRTGAAAAAAPALDPPERRRHGAVWTGAAMRTKPTAHAPTQAGQRVQHCVRRLS
jgi:hypothetical protein